MSKHSSFPNLKAITDEIERELKSLNKTLHFLRREIIVVRSNTNNNNSDLLEEFVPENLRLTFKDYECPICGANEYYEIVNKGHFACVKCTTHFECPENFNKNR